MTGFEEFLKMFGSFTISDLVHVILACAFLFLIYRKVRDYLVKRYEADKKRNEQIEEALEAVRKYPEYRKQSVAIQESLEKEILELRKAQEEQTSRLMQMEDDTARMERNKLRDRLLENYRYFTSKEHNPLQAWTRMESEAFWELFSDYEKVNGNGYVHTVVQPAMNLLKVIEMSDEEDIAELMKHRT